jgi:hypothetical protein
MRLLLLLCFTLAACNSDRAVKDDVAALDGYPLPAKRTPIRVNAPVGDSLSWKYVIPGQTPDGVATELKAALEKAGWTITKAAPSDLSAGGIDVHSEHGGKTYYARAWLDRDNKRTILDLEQVATPPKVAAPPAP